jgi:hypothetical protein
MEFIQDLKHLVQLFCICVLFKKIVAHKNIAAAIVLVN